MEAQYGGKQQAIIIIVFTDDFIIVIVIQTRNAINQDAMHDEVYNAVRGMDNWKEVHWESKAIAHEYYNGKGQ